MSHYDVMVDLETTGTDRSHAAILQIAAAVFDYETGRIGACMSINLEMPPTRFWDEDTRNWWAKQPPEVFDKVTENPTAPAWGIRTFADWVNTNTGSLHPLRLWAKPSSFEYPLLESYFHEFGVQNPFHFRDVVDMRSFLNGLQRNPAAPALDKTIPFEGDAHNALDDVFHQIKVVLTAKLRFANGNEDHQEA